MTECHSCIDQILRLCTRLQTFSNVLNCEKHHTDVFKFHEVQVKEVIQVLVCAWLTLMSLLKREFSHASSTDVHRTHVHKRRDFLNFLWACKIEPYLLFSNKSSQIMHNVVLSSLKFNDCNYTSTAQIIIFHCIFLKGFSTKIEFYLDVITLTKSE